MSNLNGILVHDTRGRKIISVDKAKKEVIASYILWLVIVSLVRNLIGGLIDLEVNSLDEYLKPAIVYGILDLLMFLFIWVATFKFSMNKYSIRNVEKMMLKATIVMINIAVCVYICVSFLYNVKSIYSEYENDYNSLVKTYSVYSSYSPKINEVLTELENTLKHFKDVIYSIIYIKIALSICGNFLGCALVRKDIEKIGIDEEEYKMCMNIDIENDFAGDLSNEEV